MPVYLSYRLFPALSISPSPVQRTPEGKKGGGGGILTTTAPRAGISAFFAVLRPFLNKSIKYKAKKAGKSVLFSL